MDLEGIAQTVARFASVAAPERTWVPPVSLKADGPFTREQLLDIQQEGELPMRRWATKVLNHLRASERTSVDGEPITWAEACDIEHPLLVALKAYTAPGYEHLRQSAREYMAASPTRAPLRADHRAGGTRVAVKAAENHTGAMVALIPSDQDIARLAPLGTEDADELHVTLHYPGEASELDGDGVQKLLPRLRALAATSAPIHARVAGVALFNPTGDTPAHVLILNHPTVHRLRNTAADIVEQNLSAPLTEQHMPWIPHITLGYGGERPDVPDEVFDNGVTLDKLRLAWGPHDVDIPLTGA